MPLVAELLDWQEEGEEEDIFAILDDPEQAQELAAASATQEADQLPAEEEAPETDLWDELLGVLGPAAAVAAPAAVKKKKRKKSESIVYGSLFDLMINK